MNLVHFDKHFYTINYTENVTHCHDITLSWEKNITLKKYRIVMGSLQISPLSLRSEIRILGRLNLT